MRFSGLSIQAIRSFVGDHVFHFPTSPGVYFVGGDNRKYPEKGPNGCGKSAIWDALSFVIYGKSTVGQKAGDVATWSRKNATIGALDFEKDGIQYSITRTWDPNSLTLQVGNEDPKVVEQRVIDELVGLTYTLFLAIVVMAQFGVPFMRLGKTKKLEFFSSVLGLDPWTARATKAGQDASAASEAHDECQSEVTQLKDRLFDQSAALLRECERRGSWAADHAESVRAAESAVVRCTEAHRAAVSEVSDLQAQRTTDLDWIREAQRDLEGMESRADALADSCAQWNIDLLRIDNELAAVRDAQHGISNITGDCPYCHQAVPAAHVSVALATLEDKCAALCDRAAPIASDRDRANVDALKLRTKYDDRSSGLAGKRAALASFGRTLGSAEQRSVGAGEALREAESRLVRVRDEVSPHDAAVDEYKAKIDLISKNLASASADCVAFAARATAATELSDYFRDVRLFICEQAMSEFSVVAASTVEQLGLVGWQVRCEMEKPTKRGKSATRGFQVLIKAPGAPDWVPWESWCGGETQRLSLAGSVAFSDLACSRLGVSTSIEVWDEPTAHLSTTGVADLLSYLQSRARRLGRQIFVVDHRSIDAGEFAGSYTVVMDQDGSRIESGQIRRNERCDQVLNKVSGRRRFSALQLSASV